MPDLTEISEALLAFGVGGRKARRLMTELFSAVLAHMVRDEQIDDAEAAYLKRLRSALSVADKEVERAYEQVIHPIYQHTTRAAMSDHKLTPSERSRLDALVKDLRIDPRVAAELYSGEAQAHLAESLEKVTSDERLSPDEEAILTQIATGLGIDLPSDERTKGKLARMALLWRIDNGQLPEVDVSINLQKKEVCHAAMSADWYEPRTRTQTVAYTGFSVSVPIVKGVRYRAGTVKPVRVEIKELVHVGTGTLYLTNKRLIFDGNEKNTTVRHSSIIRFVPLNDGMRLEKASGRPPLVRFRSGDVDLFHSIFAAALAAE